MPITPDAPMGFDPSMLGRRERLSGDEDELRRYSEYGRGSWLTEALRTTENPQLVTRMTRTLLASFENPLNMRYFTRWRAESPLSILADRSAGYGLLLNMDPDELVGLDLVDRYSFEYDEKHKLVRMKTAQGRFGTKFCYVENGRLVRDEGGLTSLAEALESSRQEVVARTTLLEAYQQQLQYSGDIETYASDLFKSPYRITPEARHYGIIGNLGRTSERERTTLGQRVDKAMRMWVDYAEGKRVRRTLATGKDENINPFGGELIESRLEFIREEIKAQLEGDDAAVQLAYILLRHFDVDVSYAIKGSVIKDHSLIAQILESVGEVSPAMKVPTVQEMERGGLSRNEAEGQIERIKQFNRQRFFLRDAIIDDSSADPIKIEASQATADSAKAAFLSLRQLAETAGPDYPFASAAPATIGCFPNLIANAMQVMVLSEVDEFGNEVDDGEKISLWTLWRDRGVPLGELPWDRETWEHRGKRFTGVPKVFQYETAGVQGYYAVSKIFGAIMRTDFAKAGLEENLSPNYLYELNKGWTVGMGNLFEGVGLGNELGEKDAKKLRTKLMQLTKVNMLAGFGIACTYSNSPSETVLDYMGAPMINDRTLLVNIETGTYLASLENAATVSQFFSTRDSFKRKGDEIILPDGRTLFRAEKDLLKHLIETRRLGVKPSLLVNGQTGTKGKGFKWFTEAEITAINKARLFAPFLC